jgi:predicted nuclease of predicted toxin-antitoxin system
MKIYMDVNVPQKIASRVRAQGYTVEYVPRRESDREILAIALKENALLITYDKDFERLILDEYQPTAGVVIMRMSERVPVEDRATLVVNALRKHEDKIRGNCCSLSEAFLDVQHPSY